MIKDNDRISSFEMYVLIFTTLNAIEVLFGPRTHVAALGTDGWIAICGGHLIGAGVMFYVVKLGLLFPNETLVEYAPRILGKYIGVPLVVLASSTWCLITARIVRQFADFVELILPQTPIEIIIVTMLLVAAYVARHGIEPISRVLVILFPLFIGVMGLLIFIAVFEVDLSNLLPVFQASPKETAVYSASVFFGLEGQEVLLMLLPFLRVSRDAYKVGLGALASNLILRLSLFVVTVSIFGVDLIQHLVWPVEELARSLNFAGGSVGRLDSLFIALWVTVAFSSILVFYYLASMSFSRVMKFKEPSITVLPLLPIIFLFSLLPSNVAATEILSEYFKYLTGGYLLVVPPLLLLVTYIRGTHLQKTPDIERDRKREQERETGREW